MSQDPADPSCTAAWLPRVPAVPLHSSSIPSSPDPAVPLLQPKPMSLGPAATSACCCEPVPPMQDSSVLDLAGWGSASSS